MEPYSLAHHSRHHLDELIQKLSTLISEERQQRLVSRLQQRLRSVVCVFENTNHSHNISAMLRTVDALGFLESIFVYDQPNMRFRQKDNVERGASQWLLTRRADNIEQAATHLKNCGYTIGLVSLPTFERTAATYKRSLPQFSAPTIGLEKFRSFIGPSEKSPDVPIRPMALVLGNELHGVAQTWTRFADCYLCVDMRGFVESLNVSVCAGILLHQLREFYAQHERPIDPTSHDGRLLHAYWLTRAAGSGLRYLQAAAPELLDLYEFIKRGQFHNPLNNDRWRHG
jgi:tRNA (guanosine-2'-O-)-methyltransferase